MIARGAVFIAAAAAVVFSGCEAEMIITRKKVKGPVAEVGLIDAGGGEIKYALWGPDVMVRQRRRDAMEKIDEYCGGAGKYKIVDEVERGDMETPYNADDIESNIGTGGAHYRKVQYHHLFFECLKK